MLARADSGRTHPAKALAAFAAIYFIWGSTFLAIRYAIETIPPFSMVAARSLVSGAVLYAWARRRGAGRPRLRQWLSALRAGALLFVGGQALVAWSAQRVATGLVALLLATIPLWMALLERMQEPGLPSDWRVNAGILLGTAGVGLLVGPSNIVARGGVEWIGGGVLLLASLSWAAGSIYARTAPRPPSTLMTAGMQLLAGGALLVCVGALAGERPLFVPAGISARSALSLLYLIAFGSIVGFTAYVWLLRATSAARVSTYAYVNPVVAMLLGWAVVGEPLTPRNLLAAAAILAGVILIVTCQGKRGDSPPPRLLPKRWTRALGGVRIPSVSCEEDRRKSASGKALREDHIC